MMELVRVLGVVGPTVCIVIQSIGSQPRLLCTACGFEHAAWWRYFWSSICGRRNKWIPLRDGRRRRRRNGPVRSRRWERSWLGRGGIRCCGDGGERGNGGTRGRRKER